MVWEDNACGGSYDESLRKPHPALASIIASDTAFRDTVAQSSVVVAVARS